MGIFGTKSKKDKQKQETDKEVKSVAQGEAAGAENPTLKGEKQEEKVQKLRVKHSATAMACDVIIAPIVTEKSHSSAQKGKYTFKVARSTNKKIVAKLIADIYKVTVTDVNIVNIPRKRRTVKYDRGYQKAFKKAIVTVKKGDHIAAFDLA